MNAPMTEKEAASFIGWTTGNLRSHRERATLAGLAEDLTTAQKRAIMRLSQGSALGFQCVTMLQVTRPVPGGSVELNSRGKELARVLVRRRRPTTPPAFIRIDGRVMYEPKALSQWLDDHPAAKQRSNWLDQGAAAARLGITPSTLKTMRYRSNRARRLLDRDAHSEEEQEALERQISAAPPHHLVGKTIRYSPEELSSWRARRRAAHPLERDLNGTGPLISPKAAASLMEIEPQSLVGYRSRAGGAIRRIQRGVARDNDQALACSAPRHVRIGRSTKYYLVDVLQWVEDHREG